MFLSMFSHHFPQIHVPPWKLLYWAALFPGIFAQDTENKCTISSPHAICVLGEVLGTVGGEATLPCNFTFTQRDTEITKMSWKKGHFHGWPFINKSKDGSITNTGTIKHHKQLDIVGDVSSGKVSLKIRNLNLNDDGTYYCRFWYNTEEKKNDAFTSYPGTRLVVGVKPKISFVNQSFNGTIDLTCKGSGIPLPNLDLLHPNGTKLNTMKKKDSKEIKLHINIAEAVPVGKYTCVGTNIHGETRVEIILGLKDEPTSLTVEPIAGIVFLSLLLVAALIALILWRRRKTAGKGKGSEDKPSSTTCKVSTSSPTTLELPGRETTYETLHGTSSGNETTYETLRGASSGKETTYETLCGISSGKETAYETLHTA
uniref:Allogenic leukocyte antigen n=1 Tax=Eptatretus burgeri TaxID=7764 RepID=N0DTS6_EPTBU|nr:allogenic leukocyte antigen [Eptatretus burgeri]